MQHSEFTIGMIFYSSLRAPQPYVVTDIGTRVIVASIYTLPADLDHPGRWMEFTFPADELQYCDEGAPPKAEGYDALAERQKLERDEPRGLSADEAPGADVITPEKQMSMF